MTSVGDVFGIATSKNPLSYIERTIDDRFKEALAADEHSAIMIYGTSKQGKSSLRRHVLPDEFCTFVPAAANMSTEGLYREVLNQAKVFAQVAKDEQWKVSGDGGVPSWLEPIIRLSAKVERNTSSLTREVEVDYSVAGSVARKYREVAGHRPIVIDNFHYFSPEIQSALATDIRAFEEKAIKVVVMGTWKDRDYLVRANPDLSGRVCALSIEPWSDRDFERVISVGSKELNVSFSPAVREALIGKAAGNIGLLQKALRELLRKSGITEQSKSTTVVNNSQAVRAVYRDIAKDLVTDKAAQLKKITEIGDRWFQRHSRTYFVVKAFVSDSQSDHIQGVALTRLIAKTHELVERETAGSQTIPDAQILTLLTRDFLPGQQRLIKTPMIAYDQTEERIVPLDSWLLFTLRHHREDILEEFN